MLFGYRQTLCLCHPIVTTVPTCCHNCDIGMARLCQRGGRSVAQQSLILMIYVILLLDIYHYVLMICSAVVGKEVSSVIFP